jgi:hypothetical protein
MDDNVVQLGGGRKPPPQQPPQPRGPRPIGVRMPGLIVTGHLEERMLVDRHGDHWMPITYITVEGRAQLLMNCADAPPEAHNDV